MYAYTKKYLDLMQNEKLIGGGGGNWGIRQVNKEVEAYKTLYGLIHKLDKNNTSCFFWLIF